MMALHNPMIKMRPPFTMVVTGFLHLFTSLLCLMLALPTNCVASTITVQDTNSLQAAIQRANKGEIDIIYLAAGFYPLTQRLRLERNGIALLGQTGRPSDVVLVGSGMVKTAMPEILIDVAASQITISGLTLKESSNHLIQVRAELGVSDFSLTNAVLQDSYEQLLKVSGQRGEAAAISLNGLIENCVFEYTDKVGPNYYIGGIDAHRVHGWRIINNTFRNIASPSKYVAQYAIHLWNNSVENIVSGNTIIDSDRGIGFGMGDLPNTHAGGLIMNNVIVHTNNNNKFSDVGISLESTPLTQISRNVIFFTHSYPNAIEYRFPATIDTLIEKNVTNRRISSRDGGSAALYNNHQSGSLLGGFLYLINQLSQYFH
ncbi:MAG: hypothetical protein K9K86_00660 [Pseudomonadales bacterium]|nr:hypothetical protein [Pseudomonadales bacterium]